ncbi:MAG: TerC family protein [Hallerella porci]|uniref:Tellurite resistance protein TerC n=1 Tax=Hallerella porci TaxID=1945871 RepID=A0ABX5LK46_9BACT|nr:MULTISPECIES: TerC family protein [Hallerella]MCI5599686.1 TerC family protein [Hallerella sp.]MDY3922387.1 TerC family protein [Hallerella porci]PWK95141.1 tellurite resistance protein TerC [Hallerella porci]
MLTFWLIFLAFVAVLLALDLGVFHKKDHVIGVREALVWTGIWILLSLAFSVAIYFIYGDSEHVLEYLTGYVIEKSLSLDNIFVMAAIFTYFKIPAVYQHRILFWGILGAIVLRGAFILMGAVLIEHFSWVIYVFGVLLLYSAFKMLFLNEDEQDLSQNKIVKIARRFLPLTTKIEGHHFFIRENHKLFATPLFLALIVVELSDILFAVDSIPAIFGVTLDPFIVFTSNIMAILGLRSLYFALAAMLGKFDKLKYAIVFVLAFVGIKMLIADFVHIPTAVSLAVIVVSLVAGVIASQVKR